MTDRKYFNVTLSRDMIAQAYQDNESYNSHCFLIGPITGHLPEGFEIISAVINNGHLDITYTNKTGQKAEFYIENGRLFLKLTKGGEIMAVVDVGEVIGPQGPQGIQGEPGITPTFIIGDGTGGTTEGHLYVDYDHPYTPT